jgi:hypothetical protein
MSALPIAGRSRPAFPGNVGGHRVAGLIEDAALIEIEATAEIGKSAKDGMRR